MHTTSVDKKMARPFSLRRGRDFVVRGCSLPAANAQTAGTGSIQGAVADQTGAVLQNASVTITNTATDVQHKTTSGADGLYSFPNVPIGVYTLDVSASGFERYSQAGDCSGSGQQHCYQRKYDRRHDRPEGGGTRERALPCRRKTLLSSRPLTRRRSRNCPSTGARSPR